MPYGTIKVDNIIFTNGGSDQTVTVSGIVASTSGNLTVTGTISGGTVKGTYGSFTSLTGVTTSGTNANFQTITGAVGVYTTSISGLAITGNTAGFTTVTGTTVTGTTANFVTLSGTTISRNGFNVVTVGDVGTVTSTMIASGTIIDANVNISGAINATKLNFLQAGTGAVARTIDSKLKDAVSVKDFGAVGDGVVDDTAAIQAAINTLASNSTLVFPPANYKIATITFDGITNVTVLAYGARFALTGDGAGFVVKGITTGFTVKGGVIVGDGANRDALANSTLQIGWLFGNQVGAYVQNVIVEDVYVVSTNVGFLFAAGSGSGSGNTNNVKVFNCQAQDCVGLVGGRGYGFQFSQSPFSSLTNCQAINCQRHGIYFAEGRDYTATNCILRNHRSTVYNNSYRVAFEISRSKNVAVSNCLFDNCFDGSLGIDSDTQGTAPDNVLNGVSVTGCTFLDSALADIRIGTDPVADANVSNVLVSNCLTVRKTNNVDSIVIESGLQVKITDCLLRGPGTGTPRGIVLNATGGSSYTDNVEIVRNSISNFNYGLQIASALQTGTSSIQIKNNYISNSLTAELEFVSSEDSTTNNTLIYKRTNGLNTNRSYSSSGTAITVPVGGVDSMYFAPSGATTVSNFSGGTDGQELTLYFGNANTTLLASNLYLAGAVNFVSSNYDTLKLIYKNGGWRELSRSLN